MQTEKGTVVVRVPPATPLGVKEAVGNKPQLMVNCCALASFGHHTYGYWPFVKPTSNIPPVVSGPVYPYGVSE